MAAIGEDGGQVVASGGQDAGDDALLGAGQDFRYLGDHLLAHVLRECLVAAVVEQDDLGAAGASLAGGLDHGCAGEEGGADLVAQFGFQQAGLGAQLHGQGLAGGDVDEQWAGAVSYGGHGLGHNLVGGPGGLAGGQDVGGVGLGQGQGHVRCAETADDDGPQEDGDDV